MIYWKNSKKQIQQQNQGKEGNSREKQKQGETGTKWKYNSIVSRERKPIKKGHVPPFKKIPNHIIRPTFARNGMNGCPPPLPSDLFGEVKTESDLIKIRDASKIAAESLLVMEEFIQAKNRELYGNNENKYDENKYSCTLANKNEDREILTIEEIEKIEKIELGKKDLGKKDLGNKDLGNKDLGNKDFLGNKDLGNKEGKESTLNERKNELLRNKDGNKDGNNSSFTSFFSHKSSQEKPYLTTSDIDFQCQDFIMSKNAYPVGCGFHGFPRSICTSVNEVCVHGIPDDQSLEYGDIVFLYFCICKKFNLSFNLYYKNM